MLNVKFYTKDDDGLSKDWSNEIVFMNPLLMVER